MFLMLCLLSVRVTFGHKNRQLLPLLAPESPELCSSWTEDPSICILLIHGWVIRNSFTLVIFWPSDELQIMILRSRALRAAAPAFFPSFKVYSSRYRPSDNFSQLCYGFQAEIPSSHAISSCANQDQYRERHQIKTPSLIDFFSRSLIFKHFYFSQKNGPIKAAQMAQKSKQLQMVSNELLVATKIYWRKIIVWCSNLVD